MKLFIVDAFTDAGGIHVVGIGLDIDERRLQPALQDDVAGGDEGSGRTEDLVAVAPSVLLAQGEKRHLQGGVPLFERTA